MAALVIENVNFFAIPRRYLDITRRIARNVGNQSSQLEVRGVSDEIERLVRSPREATWPSDRRGKRWHIVSLRNAFAAAHKRRDQAVPVDLAHATIQLVADGEFTTLGPRDVVGTVQQRSGRRPAVAQKSRRSAACNRRDAPVNPDAAHNMVERVRDEYTTIARNGEARRRVQRRSRGEHVLGRLARDAGACDGGDDAVRTDAAHDVVLRVGKVDRTIRCSDDGARCSNGRCRCRTAVARARRDAGAGDRRDDSSRRNAPNTGVS